MDAEWSISGLGQHDDDDGKNKVLRDSDHIRIITRVIEQLYLSCFDEGASGEFSGGNGEVLFIPWIIDYASIMHP